MPFAVVDLVRVEHAGVGEGRYRVTAAGPLAPGAGDDPAAVADEYLRRYQADVGARPWS